jgi:pyruvate kinase
VQFPREPDQSRQGAVCTAVIKLAQDLPANAIVAETHSGATALQLATRRPSVPLIAVTPDPRVAQQLAIVYGTKAYVRPAERLAATKLTNWLLQAKALKKDDIVVTASGKHPGVVGTTDTIKVRVL